MADRWGDKQRAKQMETNQAIYFYVDYFVFPAPAFFGNYLCRRDPAQEIISILIQTKLSIIRNYRRM